MSSGFVRWALSKPVFRSTWRVADRIWQPELGQATRRHHRGSVNTVFIFQPKTYLTVRMRGSSSWQHSSESTSVEVLTWFRRPSSQFRFVLPWLSLDMFQHFFVFYQVFCFHFSLINSVTLISVLVLQRSLTVGCDIINQGRQLFPHTFAPLITTQKR